MVTQIPFKSLGKKQKRRLVSKKTVKTYTLSEVEREKSRKKMKLINYVCVLQRACHLSSIGETAKINHIVKFIFNFSKFLLFFLNFFV